MNKKWWFLPATVLAVFGLLMLGCPSSGGGNNDDDDDAVAFSYEFKGDGSEYTLWGNDLPKKDGAWLEIDGKSTSTGFIVKFADIGYTYKASDTLVFTYSVEITTPEACLSVKIPKGNNFDDLKGGADYGIGKGKEVFLGSSLKDGDKDASTYTGPATNGTWDAATKTGTFEVLMKHLGAATGVGFQHNNWAEMPSKTKVAENAAYKVKFLKVENKAGAEVKCECEGNENACDICGDDCKCDPCAPPAASTDAVVFSLAAWLTANPGKTALAYGDRPLQATAGEPVVYTIDATGISVTARTAYSGIDLWIDGAAGNLVVDLAQYKYKIVVEGVILEAGAKVRIQGATGSYSQIAAMDADGVLDATYTLTGDIPANYITSNSGVIRITTEGSTTNSFRVTKIELSNEGPVDEE